MTYEECVEYILSVPLFANKLGTDNLNNLLELMDHPEDKCPVIHVAGTNGKGSTCSFLASILQTAGYHVGLFTSPHLVKINERIRVDGDIISDEAFVEVFQETMDYVEQAKQKGIAHPSFFELVFLMACLYFAKRKVDYVILETGMGGRLDATNVVTPIVSVITSVGLDHVEFLGDTIEKIAGEKAGIIKRGIPAVFFDRKDEATDVISDFCKKMEAPLYIVEKKQYKILKIAKKAIDFSFKSGYHEYIDLKIKKTALYQVENAILAIQAFELILLNDRVRIAECESSVLTVEDIDCIKAGLYNMTWPCRMQEITEGVFIDGAHNEEAIEAFCKTLEVLFPTEHKILLFAVSKDKDYISMIKRLCRISFDEIILVRYEGSRSAELDTVQDAFRRFSGSKITAFDDMRTGYLYCRSHVKDRYLFCVGSLYLAGDLLKFGV